MAASTIPRAFLALAVCLVLVLLVVVPAAEAQRQGGCVPQLNRLLACRAYLVPGAADPSADRCNTGQVNCSA